MPSKNPKYMKEYMVQYNKIVKEKKGLFPRLYNIFSKHGRIILPLLSDEEKATLKKIQEVLKKKPVMKDE